MILTNKHGLEFSAYFGRLLHGKKRDFTLITWLKRKTPKESQKMKQAGGSIVEFHQKRQGVKEKICQSLFS